MKLLILDTETTSADTSTCEMAEIAVSVFDTQSNTVLASFSTLLSIDGINGAEGINKINSTALVGARDMHRMVHFTLKLIESVANECDYIIAHGKAFDKPVCDRYLQIKKPWICTLRDIDWSVINPAVKPGASLVFLALGYGIPIVDTHRAAADVGLLCKVLERVENLEAVIEEALIPSKLIVAVIEYKDVEARKEAQERGFVWTNIVPKYWAKWVKINSQAEYGFPVKDWVPPSEITAEE